MATYRTTLYSALDPVAGVGANLQQTVTINNDVTLATSVTYQLTAVSGGPVNLVTAAGLPNSATVDCIIITNLDASSETATVTLTLTGGSTVVLPSGGQFMISGLKSSGLNASAWTLFRSVAGTTLVRIEYAV
jgi:hypothetical protein